MLGIPKSTIHHVIVQLKEIDINKQRPGSIRSRTARTPANKRIIKGIVQRNSNSRKNFLRKFGKAIEISNWTVQNILMQNVGMKSRKLVKTQLPDLNVMNCSILSISETNACSNLIFNLLLLLLFRLSLLSP